MKTYPFFESESDGKTGTGRRSPEAGQPCRPLHSMVCLHPRPDYTRTPHLHTIKYLQPVALAFKATAGTAAAPHHSGIRICTHTTSTSTTHRTCTLHRRHSAHLHSDGLSTPQNPHIHRRNRARTPHAVRLAGPQDNIYRRPSKPVQGPGSIQARTDHRPAARPGGAAARPSGSLIRWRGRGRGGRGARLGGPPGRPGRAGTRPPAKERRARVASSGQARMRWVGES